jgi:hypothetical protein
VRGAVRVRPRLLTLSSSIAVGINLVYMLVLAIALKWTFLIFVGAIVVGIALFYSRKYGLFR